MQYLVDDVGVALNGKMGKICRIVSMATDCERFGRFTGCVLCGMLCFVLVRMSPDCVRISCRTDLSTSGTCSVETWALCCAQDQCVVVNVLICVMCCCCA